MQANRKEFLKTIYIAWFGVPVFIYQLFTARMISQIFGDLFVTQLMIIAASYSGHALGSLLSPRWKKGPSLVHLSLAILGGLLFFFWSSSQKFLSAGYGGLFLAYFIFFLISFFSSLLFPLLFSAESGLSSKYFNKIYFWFHFLVLFAIVGIDLKAVSFFGLKNLILLLVVLDLFWAFVWQLKKTVIPTKPLPNFLETLKTHSKFFTPFFVLSVFSGVFQAIIYKQIQTSLAPLAFHYTLFLAALLLGWSVVGAVFLKISSRFANSWQSFKENSSLWIAAIILWLYAWPVLWAGGMDLYFPWSGDSFWVRTWFVVALTFPAAFIFGALLPLAQKEKPELPVGFHFGINSAGNALGVALYVGILAQLGPAFYILTTLALTSFAFLYAKKAASLIKKILFVALLLALTSLLTQTFNWNLGSYYHRGFRMWKQTSQQIMSSTVYRTRGSQVSLVELASGERMMFMNGHYSVLIPANSSISRADVMMGLPALHYVKNTEQALIIGLGTGFTGLGTAQVFSHLDIVDLDPTMIKLTAGLTAGEALLEKPSVQFIEADGLTYLRTHKKVYDLIINNVPSPVYFASSKLWTAEAFQAIHDSLSDNGIFFQWLSEEFNRDELNIVFKEMKKHFLNCDLYVLGYRFHGLVCAKDQQALSFSEKPADILAGLLKMPPETYLQTLKDISFTGLQIPETPNATLENTLDRPNLEMLTSQQPPGWEHDTGKDQVLESLQAIEKSHLTTAVELQKKCASIMHWLWGSSGAFEGHCKDLGL